ncbi:hypothetical protein G7054_g2609 [Neopestalotiopsis clavispora]|nr:hypothetical protein G7054_g2609 [Neopestalotiopsis clavispora]
MTVSKAFLGLRGNALAAAQLLLVVAPAFILFGYNQSNLGGLVSLEDWTRVFPAIDTKHTTGHQKSTNATLQGLVIATFTLGALPGCLSCSYTADRFGRRPIIALGALLTLVGEILEASSFHIAQLITGRVILGVGVGMLSGVVPTWQSECSSSETRGRQVVLSGLFIALGYVMQAWINLGFYQFSAGPLTWRPPISIAAFFKIAAIELSLEEQGGKKARLGDLLKMGEDKLLYRFGICLLLQFYQQMSGGNLISVYSTVIFQNGLGLDAQTSRILSGGTLTWKFISCFVSFFTIDRLGRRLAFMVSGTGMATCMLGLAVATSFPTSNFGAQITSVLFVFLFNFFIPIGFLGANFLYCAEIAPLRLRVAMSSISTANHWLCNFLVTMITPVAIQTIGYRYYILYTVIGFCIPFTVYFLYPETMGMRLEDIDLVFRESPSVWATVKFAKSRQQRTETEILGDKHMVEHQEKNLAFSGPGWTVTYGELEKRTRRIATHLVDAGVGRGHFVAIVLGRCLQAVESVLAITRACGIGVPLDPRSPAPELIKLIKHCDARVVITDGRHLAAVRTAVGKGSLIVLTTDIPDVGAMELGSRVVRYRDWAEDNECLTLHFKIDDLGEEEAAFLHYTSGTTDSPKGVLSNQNSRLLSANSLISALDLTTEDHFFCSLPLFHIFGHLFCIITTVVAGGSAFIPNPDQTPFDGLKDMQARESTIIVGATATFLDIVDTTQSSGSKSPLSLSLSKLRACIYGGSPAPVSLATQVEELLGAPLLGNYGCTEAGFIATCKPTHSYSKNSSLAILPHWDTKLVDPDGNRIEDGKKGELLIKGLGLMIGYHKEAQSFTVDGWYSTGDIATISSSAAGTFLTLVGRRKEVIIRGGENIHPHEIEGVLLRQPGVADAVVAGIPHKLLGEVPAAFIVKSAPDLDLSNLLAACRRGLPDYKVPTAFYEIGEVPRTVIGKPKRSIMTSLTNRPLTIRHKLQSRDSVESLLIMETIAACSPNIEIEEGRDSNIDWLREHFNEPFSFLGLNSMAGVVLRDRLSSLTGLNLPSTLVFDYPTPAALSQYLHGQVIGLEPPTPRITISQPLDYAIEPIAIVSMACRYPGGVSSPEDLWKLVLDEVDATTEFPDDRGWDIEALYDTNPDVPHKSTTKRGGFLPDFAHFDAGLFGMAPREALATDPQQRLLLETTWELAERGNIPPLSLQGSQTGVFLGTLYENYDENGLGNDELEAHITIGSSSSVLSGRVSYCFGFHGPSVAISTGCSSSLVAIHQAAQALRNGECDLAIAGGVTTMANPRPFTTFSRRRGLSPDGRCRVYSGDANGTGWSEGVGLILLERYSEAKRHGRQILGLIRGSAVNSDGKSNGLTAPNGAAQQMCIHSALGQAGLSPGEIDLLEGHGSATALGDPIEIQAVISSYGNGRGNNSVSNPQRSTPLLLGSIKSNIGHTQAAAAVAGVIKMVQAIRHGIAPASLHIREPSQHIDWKDCGVELLSMARKWPSVNRPRRAAVSSFGIGGTNSHVILEQPDSVELESSKSSTSKKALVAFPWLISGASEAALRAQARSLLNTWKQTADKSYNPLHDQDPVDIAFTLATARSALKHKAAITYSSNKALLRKEIEIRLENLARGEQHPHIVTRETSPTGNKPRVAFLFAGQGGCLPSLDDLEELGTIFPSFFKAFQEACVEIDQQLEFPLMHAWGDDTGRLLNRVDYAQAALFVFEVAMVRLLQSLNVLPDLVAGHSLGEIVAAHIAGNLSLRDAATIVVTRAKFMASLPPEGAMASISATEEEVAKELSRLNSTATAIAAVNSRESVVISGPQSAVKDVAERFASLGRRATLLRNINHGFHSPMMDGILSDMEEKLMSSLESDAMLVGDKVIIPLVSTVTGKRADATQLRSARHWVRHVSAPVRFLDCINELESNEKVSVFVEIGGSAVLSPHVAGSVATYSTVNKLLETLGQLWTRGIPVDWKAAFEGSGARLVNLPVYAFQRQKFWVPYTKLVPAPSIRDITTQTREQSAIAHDSGMEHEMLLSATSIPGTSNIICSGYLSTARQRWLRDHVIDGQVLVPATAFTEIAMRAAQECSEYSGSERTILDELTVVAPLVLPSIEDDQLGESEEVQIQILVGESQSGVEKNDTRRTVDIYSRPSGSATNHEWTQHATGSVTLTSLSDSCRDDSIDVTVPTNTGPEVDIRKAYAVLKDGGVGYGPSFQGVRAIWRLGDNDLLAQIRPISSDGRKSTFIVHPAIFDATLHASSLASSDKIANGDVRLPFSLRGVQILTRAGSTGPILAYIQSISENCFSLTLTSEKTGVVIARVSEVRLRAKRSAESGGALYHLEWSEAQSQSAPAAKPDQTDKVVRIESHHNLAATAVVKAVHDTIAAVIRVVHDWRAEIGNTVDANRLVVVTQRAISIGDNSNVDLVAAAVWGFVRSAQAEFGRDRIVLVNLDGSTESETTLSLALASREEGVFAIQGGNIMIPRLSKPHALLTKLHQPMTLDVSGTVLITGATGGLGALLSRDTVHNHGARNLLIISRSGLEAPGARELCEEIQTANAAVRIEACDVSDRAQLAKLLQSHDIYPPVTAIVHCAGVVDDALLGSQNPELASRVLRPKVDGAWNLHELAPDTVRSFILFSSFSSVFGNVGQAAYTAGNAFLDALARFRVKRGLPGLSLAWGPWANNAGMAAPSRLSAHAVSSHLANALPLTDQQGIRLFHQALHAQSTASSHPVLLPLLLRGPLLVAKSSDVASETKQTLAQKRPGGERATFFRNLRATKSPEDRFDFLLGLVREEIAAVLGYQSQSMLPDKRLDDLGFDSFTSVLLTNRLRTLTCLASLPVTLALDHDTPQALVRYMQPLLEAELRSVVDLDLSDSTTAQTTDSVDDYGTVNRPSSQKTLPSQTTSALHNSAVSESETFRSLASIHRQLCALEQYVAAAALLDAASQALPTFPETESILSSYATDPQCLTHDHLDATVSDIPLIVIPAFTPTIKIGGLSLSMYSHLASAMRGKREVFELPPPQGPLVPRDLEQLAELHVSTIRKRFSNRPGIILGGYSAGGVVAYTVASKLTNHDGDQPRLAGFALIDTYLEVTGSTNDPEWLMALPANVFTARLGDLSLVSSAGMGGGSSMENMDLELAKMGGYSRTLRDWNMELYPLPSALPTLLIRANKKTNKMPKHEDQWRPKWSRADLTVDVSGSHLDLLEKPCARSIAIEIERWIEKDLRLNGVQ